MQSFPRSLAFVLLGALVATSLFAVGPDGERRNFDARIAQDAPNIQPEFAQNQRLEALREAVPGLTVTFDETTGVTRSLYNRTGYLTGPQDGDLRDVAFSWIQQNLATLGLTEDDYRYEITDDVPTALTGAHRIYLRQLYLDLPVYNGQLQVNVNRDGRIMSVNNAFVRNIAQFAGPSAATLNADQAMNHARNHWSETSAESLPSLLRPWAESTPQLMWLPMRRGDVRLVWNFQMETHDLNHLFDFNVDAITGEVWTRFDWVASEGGPTEQYRGYALPIESPIHTTPMPPDDARTLIVSPADATASPFGWHDTNGVLGAEFTIHRGNNVHAYDDANDNNTPPASEPDCGASLVCDFNFPIDFATDDPANYTAGAVSNLFYWNNIIHDVQYAFGFDEVNGNFQVNNYGNGGLGNDDVQAEAQDGGGTNNANFATPPDGSRPRMQMFLWDLTTPRRDGDFDNGIIIHEYGHGISNRLVGGPNNTSCLNNTQQGGEGYSDWWSVAYTAEVGDTGADRRGVGNYALGNAPDGDGIRDLPYSTDNSINTWTYESISGASVPHGVGSRWAQAAWEVFWALVDEHGFSTDLYSGMGTAGNQRAMLYVNEGLKNSICSPAFTDVRDGMIQAATDNHGGADVCLLWEAFAGFGLGTDAVSGGANSTSPTNGFEIPPECLCEPGQTIPVADAGPDQLVCQATPVTLGTPALPGHTYLWSPGGETTAQITVNPAVQTEYTLTVTTDCTSKSDTVEVFVDNGVIGIDEDFELPVEGSGLPAGWTATGLWHSVASSTCPSPEPGFSSPVTAMYYGQDQTCTYDTGAATSGELTSPVIYGVDENSVLTFDYLRVVESFAGTFDVTQVEVLAGGSTETVFLRSSADPSAGVWTAADPIDLSAYAGLPIQLIFTFDSGDGSFNSFLGWFVDDVQVTGSACTPSLDIIFADGFESGDTSAWSSVVPLIP